MRHLHFRSVYGAFVNGGVEDSWASWTASGVPSEGGVYEVFVFIPNVAADTTTWQAPYTVIHGDGASSGVIDQMGSRGRWISIGAYKLLSSSAIVYVTDATGEAQGVHCGTGQYSRLGADAVKFVRRGTTYAPDVRYNNGGWSSTATLRINGGFLTGIVIQNLGSAATGVVVVYCDRPYTSCQTATVTNNLAPLRAYGYNLNSEALLPSGWTGSITISSSNGATPLAVSINNLKNFAPGVSGGYNFSAASYGGRNVYLPRAAKSASNRTTGYTIWNITNSSADITAVYYDLNGAVTGTRVFSLGAHQVVGYHQSLDTFLNNGWQGSIALSSSQNIVAIMREDGTNTVGGYNGIVR
jgi:hypothetical protein